MSLFGVDVFGNYAFDVFVGGHILFASFWVVFPILVNHGTFTSGFNSDVISVGASGAIFGLFGALLYFGYTHRGNQFY